VDELKMTFQLAVADLAATAAFYGGILDIPLQRGLTVRGAPEHLFIKQKDWQLIFVEEDAVLSNHPVLEDRFNTYPKGVGMTFHFIVEDIEDVYEAVLSEELDILYPLEEKPYGLKEFWCFDPDGYLIVLEEPTR
jgi:predicted enzyme related to lactoylglutathione lyase